MTAVITLTTVVVSLATPVTPITPIRLARALTLAEALALAAQRNERGAASAQRVAAAEAQVDRARAFFFPQVTLTGVYTRRSGERTTMIGGMEVTTQAANALTATVRASAALFDARSFPAYRQTQRLRDAERLDAAEDRRLLAFETADAFLLTLGTEQVAAAAGRRVAFARQSLADAEARKAADLAGSNDVTRARLELANAERAFSSAQADVAEAYLQLGALLATEVSAPLEPPTELVADAATAGAAAAGAAEAGAAGDRLDDVRARRLDLAASKVRVSAADLAVEEPARRWIPSLALDGQVRTTNEEGFSGKTTDWSVALILSWTIWDGGARAADEQELRAKAALARVETAALARRVGVDVRAAQIALREAHAAVVQADAAATAASENAAEVAELYRQGLARPLEVADASVRRFDAEVGQVRERYGLALALLELRAAQGRDPLGQEPSR